MISERMSGWLDEHYGNLRDWKKYLQDYTDEQIKTVIRENLFNSGTELLAYLRRHADPKDNEHMAHLLGFEDDARRRELIGSIKDLQDKCYDLGC